jgi:glycosyltransferase involved in cell wall biosynthesis
LRIAVNTRLLIKNKLEGIGYFVYENLKIITQNHPEHEFFFLFDRDYDEEFIFSDNITPIIVGPQARHPFLYLIWFEISLTPILKKLKIDLFLSPDGYLSLRSNIPSLAVYHDLNFEHHPKDYPYLDRIYYRYFFPLFVKKATRIATVSEYTKNDIANTYHIENKKIDVVYCGAQVEFKPLSKTDQKQVKQEIANGKDYFIYIGSIQPRKNLHILINAFEFFKKKTDSQNKLIIAGALKWESKELKDAYKDSFYKQDIHFTGRVATEDLAKITASAKALILVSKLEGFGIPIIEAYFCDVPVITSNISSMPEIAGNGALLVDPESVDSIAETMIQIDADDELRNKLIKNAQLQRQKFSWEITADLLWKSIEKVLNI